MDSARNRIYECEEAAASANSEYDTARDFEDSTRKAYDEIIKSWEEQYAPYYDENVSIEIDDDTYRLDKDEIESRFTGLKTALSQKMCIRDRFILATTEVAKIPITILSRCQRYDFHRITIETIAARLSELMKAEGLNVEDKAIKYVAKAADGSMRDALSLLDQCLAFYLGKDLKYENVLDVLGAVDTAVFSKMLSTILSGDVAVCMSLMEDLIMQGRRCV